jgi:outer membrane protein assembly factor BamB
MTIRLMALFALLAPLPAAAGSLYPMEAGDYQRSNAALNPSSLRLPMHVAWHSPASFGTPRQHPLVLSDRLIQAGQAGITAYDRNSGAVLWTWLSTISDLFNAPCYDPDRDLIYQVSIQGNLAALRPSDGQVQWIFAEGTLPGKFTYGGCTYRNDRIYFTNGLSQLVCVSASTHAVLWRYTYPGSWNGADTPTVDGGKVYVANNNSPARLFCLDAVSGALNWNQVLGAGAYPAIMLHGSRIYMMRNDGKVECRDQAGGALVWSYQTGSYSISNLAVCGQLLIASSDDRYIHACNLATGQLVWKRPFTGNFARCAPLVVCGTIFVSGCAGEFYALDGATGTDIWHFNEGIYNNFVDWAEADGNLYVPDEYGRMYCFTSDVAGDPLTCQCNLSAATFTPTPPSTATLTPSPAGSFTATPSPTPSTTRTFSSTVTVTRTFSLTKTSSPSATPSVTPSPSSSPSSSATPSASPSPSVTPSISPTPTPSRSMSPTVSPTFSPSPVRHHDDVPEGHDPGDIDDGHAACYPNPVRHGSCRFAFRMDGPGRSRVRVFASDGSEAGSYDYGHPEGGLRSVECDLSGYAAGVYFFIVDRDCQNGKKSKTKLEKFLIIK